MEVVEAGCSFERAKKPRVLECAHTDRLAGGRKCLPGALVRCNWKETHTREGPT